MAQFRRFNFEDDDLTASLNAWQLGAIPFGRYYGFDWDGAASLVANFIHTTDGIVITNSDNPITTTLPMGEWKTKQGGVIQEDAAVTGTFVANPSGDPRIDLLVGQHKYIASTGGAAATYVVIQGTPAVNPVPPALTVANEQVILGQMLVPAGAVDLSNALYTRAIIPPFGGDKNIAYLHRIQTFLEENRFTGTTTDWGVCFLDLGGNIIDLNKDAAGALLTGDALRKNLRKDKFLIAVIGTIPTIVNDIIPYPHNFDLEAKAIEFFTFYPVILNSTNFFSEHAATNTNIPALGSFKVSTIQDTLGIGTLTGTWQVARGGEAFIDGVNFFNQLNALNKSVAVLSGTGIATHANTSNFLEVPTTVPNRTLKAITAARAIGGTYMTVRSDGEPFILEHNTVDAVAKKLWLPQENNIESTSDSEIFLFIEDVNYWRLIGTYNSVDTWHEVGDVTTGLGTTFVDYLNAIVGNELRFKKTHDNRLIIEGLVNKVDLQDATNITVFTLPVGYRPLRTYAIPLTCTLYDSQTGGLLFTGTCFVNINVVGTVLISAFSNNEVLNAPPLRDHTAQGVTILVSISLD